MTGLVFRILREMVTKFLVGQGTDRRPWNFKLVRRGRDDEFVCGEGRLGPVQIGRSLGDQLVERESRNRLVLKMDLDTVRTEVCAVDSLVTRLIPLIHPYSPYPG